MRTRNLGTSGLMVPAVCLGGNVFGWTVDEPGSLRLLDTAAELGLTFIDTADSYSRWVPGHTGGESETLIGKWLARRGRRDDVIIATKVGSDLGGGRRGLKAAYIEQAVQDSLQRLNTDYIDLYQAHFDDPDTPLEETLRAFDPLVTSGKVRHIGASNYAPRRLAEAVDTSRRLGLARYISLQPHYNLMERAFESELLPVVQRYELGVLPYFSLAAGFLTGKYRSEQDAADKPRGAMVGKYLNERGRRVVAALDEVAARHDATPARVSLAWLMARPAVTAPIVSATRDSHLRDMAAAAALRLTEDDLRRLDTASTPA